MRGDMLRTHFMGRSRRGSRSSSRGSRRPGRKSRSRSMVRDRVLDEDDSDDLKMREADLISKAPVLNTTADTAAKLANQGNFKPDYIIDYPEPKAKPAARKPGAPAAPAAPS